MHKRQQHPWRRLQLSLLRQYRLLYTRTCRVKCVASRFGLSRVDPDTAVDFELLRRRRCANTDIAMRTIYAYQSPAFVL